MHSLSQLPVPAGADPAQYCDRSDWNALCQFLEDIRSAIRAATWYGLADNTSDPAPSGITAYLYTKVISTVEHLIFHRSDSTEIDLSAGVAVMHGMATFTDADSATVAAFQPDGNYTVILGAPVITDGSGAVSLCLRGDPMSTQFTIEASSAFTGSVPWRIYRD